VGLSIENLTKRFGRTLALDRVSLSMADGELLALVGPSGSGKTTLLRLLAGLESPDSGSLARNGGDLLRVAAGRRGVGLVFQDYALFPHMTAARNIAFGLRAAPRTRRLAAGEIAERVRALLDLMGIEALGGRYPAELSGGEQQRVALARALAVDPAMLLLDEPFGALDSTVRRQMGRELRRVHADSGVMTVLVTHDCDEAMALADRVAVLNQGRLEQVGAPSELAGAPASPFVFAFLSETSRLPCDVVGGRARFDGVDAPILTPDAPADGPAIALLRPHDAMLNPLGTGPGISVVVEGVRQNGAARRVECVTRQGDRIVADVPEDGASPAVGGAMALLPRLVALAAPAYGEPSRR